MEITEEKLYAAFGLDQGGKEQEPAESAEDPKPEAAESGTEAAEETETESAAAPEAEGTEAAETQGNQDTEEPAEPESEGQTPEERREHAARRRQQEMQEAIQAAVQQALQQRDEEYAKQQEQFFRQAGLVNPFTREPITNMDEFRAWREEQDNQRLQRELESGKLTKETLNALIEQHPAVQAARQRQAEQEQQQQAQQEEAFRQSVEQQLTEIRKTDPTITKLSDILEKPYGTAFYEAVKRGNNFADAFYLATRGQEKEQIAEAARQSAVNNLTGKNHLKPTSFGGKAGATVTADEQKMYRLFNPDASDEAIQKYQNKYRKG